MVLISRNRKSTEEGTAHGKPNSKNNASEPLTALTLRDISAPLFRHRRLVLGVFCSVFVGSILIALFWASRYYVAKMEIVVEQDRSDSAVTASPVAAVVNNKVVTTDQVSSEVALLQGQDMFQKIVVTCGLDKKWSVTDVFLSSEPERHRAMKQEKEAIRLGKSLKVEAANASDVIDVRFGKFGEPEVPACVLQNLAKLYLEKHLQLQRPSGSSDFFSEQTEKYRNALADAEARLASFSHDAGIAAPDVVRTYMAQQVANSEAALYQARQAIAADQRRLDNIKNQMTTTPARSATAEISNSSNLLLQNLQAQLLAAQLKRTQLLLKYEPTYPLVVETDQEIAQTLSAIVDAEKAKYVNQTTDRDPTYEYLREDGAKTQADLASEQATTAALQDSIRSLKDEMVELDRKAVEQAALIREAKADEGNYLLYQTKREQERTSDALDKRSIANVAVSVPAVVPALPAYSPQLVIFLGFFFSVFLSLASGYVAEYLDPSFRTPAEVVGTLRIPVLATVPRQAA